jgi:hypothetical protein
MNATTKYVVSRTLKDADAWQNSVLLRGDAAGTVAELKAQPGGDVGDHRQRVAGAKPARHRPD